MTKLSFVPGRKCLALTLLLIEGRHLVHPLFLSAFWPPTFVVPHFTLYIDAGVFVLQVEAFLSVAFPAIS